MGDTLFEDIFEIKALDPDGKKFDKVSRIVADSQQLEMNMQLDVNTEVYPLRVGDKFTMVLAPTLSLDGTPDTGYYMPGARKSLADKFEYVMHGKLYRISEEGSDGKVKVPMAFARRFCQYGRSGCMKCGKSRPFIANHPPKNNSLSISC